MVPCFINSEENVLWTISVKKEIMLVTSIFSTASKRDYYKIMLWGIRLKVIPDPLSHCTPPRVIHHEHSNPTWLFSESNMKWNFMSGTNAYKYNSNVREFINVVSILFQLIVNKEVKNYTSWMLRDLLTTIFSTLFHTTYRGYLFFSVKDQNLLHRVNTIGNIFTSGCATCENITDGVHSMK